GYILHANVPKNFLQQDEKVHQLDNLFRIAGKDAQYLTVGIGNTVESYKSLKDSFQQARAAIHSAFLDGYGKLILFKNLSETLFHPAIDLEDQFFNQIHMGNMASSIDFLEEYIIYMSRCRQEDIPAIKDELAGISFRLNQILKKQEKIQESFVTQTINNAMEIMDIKNYLLNLLDQILDEINQLDSKGRIIFDVEKYILTNYDKDLSIKEIAENVFITPNYLCHLYKSKTGITVNSFMLETKMKKSKKLLTETNLKLGEISEKLGYSNHNYFTRTFKKYFGITPSAFRNKRL
ncbi:MAG: helix-turn-helix transcriptional regulator, partial [Clostridiales bacterium]|nr:helix-turn-helix transcriptional regulator [Clostridiales bacterium]